MSALAVALLAFSHVWPAIKPEEPDPSGPDVEHITLTSIECNLGAIPLKGRVLYRRAFWNRSLSDAQVKRLKWQNYDVRPVVVDSKGRFEAIIVGEEDILISAPGCVEQVVRVSEQTRSKRVVLSCPNRK